jgi:hypothetical protein
MLRCRFQSRSSFEDQDRLVVTVAEIAAATAIAVDMAVVEDEEGTSNLNPKAWTQLFKLVLSKQF